MSRSIIEFLEHIEKELSYLQKASKGLDYSSFENDETLKRAFSRSLEIVGEAAKMVPEKLRLQYPEIEWKAMAGMRDKLIHHYFGVDYELIWDIVENRVAEIHFQIKKVINQESSKLS